MVMVVVLNHILLSCCKIGKREAGKFERVRGLNALASVNRVPWDIQLQLEKQSGQFSRAIVGKSSRNT